MVSNSGIIKDADVLSVTLTVKFEEPGTKGVPVKVSPTRFRPGGNTPPATDHVYGGDPPDATSG
jgi:hypothetical protein